jgi:PAS domain S-box-containing protein
MSIDCGLHSDDAVQEEVLTAQEAIVAVGRQGLTAPERTVFMSDAAALLARALKLEHSGTAEPLPDVDRLWLKLDSGHGGNGIPEGTEAEVAAAADCSLAGYAIHCGHPVAVDDLSRDARFQDALLSEQHIAAALAVPLVGVRQSFGALLVCSRRPHRFTPADLQCAETIAQLMTTTIAWQRAETALDAQQRLTDRLIETTETVVLMLDLEGRLLQINQAGEQICGFAAAEITGEKLWEVFAVTHDAPTLQYLIGETRDQPQSQHLEAGLVHRNGHSKQVAWTFAAVHSAAGKPELILATGIDVTRRYEAEEQVRCMEQFLADQAAAKAASGESQPFTERRSRPRRPYPYHQLIAPVLAGQLPPRNAFVHIRCHDIASGGFSFSSPTPPTVDSYVVALGNPPSLTYLVAQVVHVTRVERNGQRSFLVGCTYTGRVTY